MSASGTTSGVSSPLVGGITTTWSCLTASRAGIFASDSNCATRSIALSSSGRVAAAAAPGPGNLSGAASGSTVTLAWLAPTSFDPATSYIIEAGSSPGAANLASFDTGNAATTLTVTAVPSGTYYVRVRATNSSGAGVPSNEIVLTIQVSTPCDVAPGAPTALAAAVNGSSLTLTWNPPSGGCALSVYAIEAGSASGLANLANVNTGNTATSFSASGVDAGTYYVRARSANGAGQSGPSNEVVVTIGGSGTSLTGIWVQNAGRILPTGPIAVAFQHVGTRLTGTITNPPQYGAFDLTQSASSDTTLAFSGTFTIYTVGTEPCPQLVLRPGSMLVNITNNTMTGSFSGVNTDCFLETNAFSFGRQ